MKGTVTISLEDYNKLTKKNELLKNKEEYLYQTAKELSVFLSFLSGRENMDKYIEQFNLQSKTSKIKFEGSKAVIEFRDVKN
tara:strand:- start:789 stop:1034 length:246 start_codon:yes stop_codon:yes gene_type:complete